jgi:hypothetical protein
MDSIYFEDSSLYLRGENIISLDEESEHNSSYMMSPISGPSMMSPISGPSQEEISFPFLPWIPPAVPSWPPQVPEYPDENTEKNLGKKRGKKSEHENDANYKPHSKYKTDNVKRTIKVDSLTSLILFLNVIMNAYNLKYSFKNLDYKYKKKIKKDDEIFDLEKFKSKKIKDILSEAPISEKYENFDREHNKNIIKQIEENVHEQFLLNLLNQNFLFFFQNVYYKKNLEKININNKEIDLSMNVNTFKDIINSPYVDIYYKDKLEKTAMKYFCQKNIV